MGKVIQGVALAAFLIIRTIPIEAVESVEDLNPLGQALAARRFLPVEGWDQARSLEHPLPRTQGMFLGLSDDGGLAGAVVHLVGVGYGGPIGLLVAFDPAGTILRVLILKDNETECHVLGLSSGSWLRQFIGVQLAQKIRLLVGMNAAGRGDIDAMSGGTVSSRAITEAIAEARLGLYLVRSRGLLQTP